MNMLLACCNSTFLYYHTLQFYKTKSHIQLPPVENSHNKVKNSFLTLLCEKNNEAHQ